MIIMIIMRVMRILNNDNNNKTKSAMLNSNIIIINSFKSKG